MVWQYLNLSEVTVFTEKNFLYLVDIKKRDFLILKNDKASHYNIVRKLKKDGVRYREIYMPDRELKRLLKKINKKILSLIHFPNYVHCGPRNRSISTAVVGHKDYKYHLSLDIDSFFDNITCNVTKKALSDIGFNDMLVNLITSVAVEDNKLPQGFPTSSLLSALVISRSLNDFYKFHTKGNIKLSVYADDILISSGDQCLLKEAEGYIAKQLKGVGLTLNSNKREIGKKGAKFRWLGLQMHPWVTYPREKLSKLQKDVYRYKMHGILPQDFRQKKKGDLEKQWKESINGKVQFAKMISSNKLQDKIKVS